MLGLLVYTPSDSMPSPRLCGRPKYQRILPKNSKLSVKRHKISSIMVRSQNLQWLYHKLNPSQKKNKRRRGPIWRTVSLIGVDATSSSWFALWRHMDGNAHI